MALTTTKTLTASGKEQALMDFYAQLKCDGIRSVTELARRARVGRAHLERILNDQASGRCTWKHVLPCLSPEAVCALKQCSAWNRWAAESLAAMEAERARAKR